MLQSHAIHKDGDQSFPRWLIFSYLVYTQSTWVGWDCLRWKLCHGL